VAVGGAAAVGWYDDARTGRADERGTKGLGGHLAALRAGRVSAGMVKLAGAGASAVVGAALARPRVSADARRSADVLRPADVLVSAGVVAGAAGLANLLDLRP